MSPSLVAVLFLIAVAVVVTHLSKKRGGPSSGLGLALLFAFLALPASAQEVTIGGFTSELSRPILESIPGAVEKTLAQLPEDDPARIALRIADAEARLAQVRRVADGTFTDAAIIGAASAWDIWTTERCIARNPNCYETNSLGVDSGEQRIALKAGVYPLKVGLCYIARRLGHHKTARVLAIGFGALDTGVGFNNYRLSRQR